VIQQSPLIRQVALVGEVVDMPTDIGDRFNNR
jgi:hypothetical protein